MLQHGEKRHSADAESGAAPRVKPALPAKPINIQRKVIVTPGSTGGVSAINSAGAGGKVKQIQKKFTAAKSLDGAGEPFDSRRHLPVANKLSEEQLRIGLEALGGGTGGNVSTTQTMSSSSPLKNISTKKLHESAGKKATPSSPNLGGCTNDCCGIILNSNNSHKQQSLQSSKNGTNCSLSSAGTAATNSAYQGVKSCFSNHEPKSSSRKLEESRIKSSSDSVDSSLSSSSGGFKDPDFITRQTMAFELYKNREPGISSTTSNTCITKPPQHIQSISQYQKSSKQLEQMLAQRLEKSLALGSGPSATVVAGSQPPPIAPHHLRARSIDTSIGTSLSTAGSGSVSGSGVGTGAGGCFLGSSTIPKQIQQKLQEEMKMQCKNIKEKFLIEKRHPQEHYKPAYRETKTAQITTDGKTSSKPKHCENSRAMDDEILKTVESMLGTNIQVVDCEKTQTIREEEVLLINGVPVTLEGSDGNAIKKALIAGEIPSCEMLNQLLFRAGVLRQPVQLETSLSVKTSTVTTEDITIARNGRILDERSCETKENNYYTSTSSEIWEPVARLKKKKQQLINAGTVDDMLSNKLRDELYLVAANESSCENVPSQPTRQNSTCTESSTSSSTESNYSSSRPVSNVSNASYDNFVCQITPTQPRKANLKSGSSTKLSPNKQSVSCDSGNDEVTLTSVYSSGIGGGGGGGGGGVGHEYYPFNDISKTNTTNSMQTDSSFGCEFSPPASFHGDEPDFAAVIVQNDVRQKKCNRATLLVRSRPQRHVRTNDTSTNNIEDPSLNDENCLVYRDGNLISGTLETLIKHMVPTDEYYPDQSYLFAFLLSTRLFIKPHELLQQVCEICHQQQQLGVYLSNNNNGVANQQKAQCLSRFACNFVQLLSEWIETFPYDFRDERVMQHVRTMTQKCITIDNKLRTEVSTLLQNLLQRLKTLEKYEEFLDKINVEGSKECDIKSGGGRADSRSSSNSFHQSTEKSSSSIHHHTSSSTSSVNSISSISSTLSTPDITDLCPSPSVLAHQLTHIELERLSYIGPEEFVQAFAKENPNVDTSIKDMKKTRNLESYVQWFNRLSYIVATEICKHSKKKQRARVIEYWIETARESFNIGNFNTLMAIIAGLNMSPIARLKKTWAKIQSAKFSILEHQMDPTSNFSSYRSTLKAAMWRSEGATDERQRIVIPFFSLLVKDLYFLNEGCSNKLPNGHINFEKFWQLAKQVNEFIGWKQVSCPYEKNPKIIMFLQTNSILNENTLAMASFDCEPPENSAEKDRYKSLKHEHYNN